MEIEEFWRPVVGFPDYEVSDHGRVRRATAGMGATKGKVLKPSLDVRGYPFVMLRRDGRSFAKRIHRLVAEAFIPNPEALPEVLHMDNNKENTHVSNFKWGTHAENCVQAGADGLLGGGNKKKTHCGNCGREYDLFRDGRRRCSWCAKERTKKWMKQDYESNPEKYRQRQRERRAS